MTRCDRMTQPGMVVKSLLFLLMSYGVAFGADRLYLATTDGHVLAIDGMTLGTHDRGSAGDRTIGNWFNSAASYTTIDVGNDDAPFGGRQVVAGDTNATVRIFNADATANPVTYAVSGPGNGVTAVAVGDFGALDNAIIVSHAIGTTGTPSNILTHTRTGENAAAFSGAFTTIGDGTVTGLSLADIDPTKAGDELIASSVNPVSLALSTGHLTGISWNGGHAVDFQQSVPNMLTGVATGDTHPGTGGDEWLHTGGNFSGNDPTSTGEAWQSFSLVGGMPTFQHYNFQAVTPANTTVDGEIADLSSSNAGLEFVGVGNDRINISGTGGNNVQVQQIDTGDNMTGVTIADVLRNDGVPEIVVSTASGLVKAYEHTTPGDLGTGFALAATLNLDPSGSGSYSIAAITSAVNPIPEPATMALMLFGVCALFSAFRHRAC